jgi:hypothetical protein
MRILSSYTEFNSLMNLYSTLCNKVYLNHTQIM